jgi:hypothetical protein
MFIFVHILIVFCLVSFRAAATRCREKRKIWVQQLEKKADDLNDTNTQLQVIKQ